MPKRSIREMTRLQRSRNSLSGKAFHAIFFLILILGTAAILFGFYLYTNSLRREYATEAWHLARVTAAAVDNDTVIKKAEEVLALYEREDPPATEEEYLALRDADYDDVRQVLQRIQEEFGASSVYFAVLDSEKMGMVYLIDSGEGAYYCPPGFFEELEAQEISVYLNGGRINAFDAMFGDSTPTPAAVSDTEEWGYLCTAAQKISGEGRYTILSFVDMDMNHIVAVTRTFLLQYILLLLIVAFILGFFMLRHLKKTVVTPLNQLSDAAAAYTKARRDRNNEGHHFELLEIRTGDEIEQLALTMKDMEHDLGAYMANLTRVTAEKERISTELDVASRIQEGIIPHIFPAFPDRKEFDIYASMTPAKEVGGDFYDFFLLDEDHLALVMADVSGKGIPAALFMMASKILINNFAQMYKDSPAKILSIVNEQICRNNPAEMFVTVWLGILELSTGKIRAANAGHEYPAVRREGGKFVLFQDRHGFVLGGMEGMKYMEYEFDLRPGDQLFQYTDGVTEAANESNELFGTSRLLEALNAEEDAGPERILENVHSAIRGFVSSADQFDDITMLCICWHGKDQ